MERTFTINTTIGGAEEYTNLYVQPLLKESQRSYFKDFISDSNIFDPDKIYRSEDPNYGIKTNLDMLVYAGIEAKKIEEFVKASAKNHKRKKYILGDFKTAKATDTATIHKGISTGIIIGISRPVTKYPSLTSCPRYIAKINSINN